MPNWSGWLGGCTLAALALLNRGWSTAVAAFVVFAFLGAIAAIRFTPYFKIGGRVIALHASDRREGRPAPTPTFPRPIRHSPRSASSSQATAGKPSQSAAPSLS